MSEMNESIQDLITNIQQKLDRQFQSLNQDASQKKDQFIQYDKLETICNPQTDILLKVNELMRKSQIPIIQQQQEIDNKNESSKQTVLENEIQDNIPQSQNQINEEHEQKISEVKQGKVDKCEQNKEGKDGEQGEDRDQQNKCQDLSAQLYAALQKKQVSKTVHQSHNGFQNSSFFNRIQDYQNKKQKHLKQERKIQQQKKYLKLKSKPDINEKSKQIVQQKHHRPIYQRYDKILEAKKKKMVENQENKKLKQQQEFQQFMNQYKMHTKIQPEECRDKQKYFNDMIAWKNKIEKEKVDKQKQKELKEIEGYTFKPEINQNSIRIVKNSKRVPIYEREIYQPKTDQSEFTFQPKINKKKNK